MKDKWLRIFIGAEVMLWNFEVINELFVSIDKTSCRETMVHPVKFVVENGHRTIMAIKKRCEVLRHYTSYILIDWNMHFHTLLKKAYNI